LQRARLDVAVEDVRVAEARAEEACLAADLAAKELNRFIRLSEAGVASEQILDSATSDRDRSRAACRAATAALGQANAQHRFARAELDLTELRAPFDGVVADLRTELGEWLTPSPPGISLPPVIELLDPNSLYIAAPIDEMDAARVRTGQRVRITVDSHRGESFEGHLTRVAPYVLDVVEQNRTVEVEANFDAPSLPLGLLPGTSADLEIITEARDDVLRIPTTAISEGDRVLCLVDGVLERRTLETGVSNWRFTEVIAGLAEGDFVVTSLDSTAIVPGAKATAGEAQ
jgi:HlyD family secretion protein